jgi:hypothetical protein
MFAWRDSQARRAGARPSLCMAALSICILCAAASDPTRRLWSSLVSSMPHASSARPRRKRHPAPSSCSSRAMDSSSARAPYAFAPIDASMHPRAPSSSATRSLAKRSGDVLSQIPAVVHAPTSPRVYACAAGDVCLPQAARSGVALAHARQDRGRVAAHTHHQPRATRRASHPNPPLLHYSWRARTGFVPR